MRRCSLVASDGVTSLLVSSRALAPETIVFRRSGGEGLTRMMQRPTSKSRMMLEGVYDVSKDRNYFGLVIPRALGSFPCTSWSRSNYSSFSFTLNSRTKAATLSTVRVSIVIT
jgi:hypothetical protein